MTLKRTLIGAATAVTLAAISLSGCSSAEGGNGDSGGDYPSKSIRLIIPYGAGGGTDLSARLMVSGLEEVLGARVVVENDPAASGQNALNTVANAQPDGYTLGFAALPATNMMYLDAVRGATFDRESFTPIATHDTDPIAIAVSGTSAFETLEDVIDAAQDEPGSVTAGSSGVLATGHLGILALQKAAGIEIIWTTFEDSGQLRTSVLGESVTIEIGPVSELATAHESGEMRILALMAEAPQEGLDVPTTVELGYEDALVATNRVLIGPAGLPDDIVKALADAVQEAMESNDYQEQARSRSLNLNFMSAAEASAMWEEFDTNFGPIAEEFRAGE